MGKKNEIKEEEIRVIRVFEREDLIKETMEYYKDSLDKNPWITLEPIVKTALKEIRIGVDKNGKKVVYALMGEHVYFISSVGFIEIVEKLLANSVDIVSNDLEKYDNLKYIYELRENDKRIWETK